MFQSGRVSYEALRASWSMDSPSRTCLPWMGDCVHDSVLPRLPTELMDDSSSCSSDEELEPAATTFRRAAGDRRAMPVIKTAFYPGGAPPKNWCCRNTISVPSIGELQKACMMDVIGVCVPWRINIIFPCLRLSRRFFLTCASTHSHEALQILV